MTNGAIKAYNTNILKVYGLVYTVVALPMAYYGFNYIKLINSQMTVSLPLLGLVMASSVVAACLVQLFSNRHIRALLNGRQLRGADTLDIKKNAYYYPLRLVVVMVSGWFAGLNLIVFLPIYLIYHASMTDLVVCNLLTVSCGLMSTPMTYFISEKTAAVLLSLDEVKPLPEPAGIFRISLTAKILVVCLIIIGTLILNTSASILLSVSYRLSQAETVANLSIISFFGVLCTVVISLLFARSLKESIANMREGTDVVKSGNLSASVPRLTNDELGDTADSFNSFVGKLADTIAHIKSSVNDTCVNVGNLQQAMGNTDDSVGEINRNAAEVQASVTNQSSIITEVTATMQQIARTIESQDKRINDQSASVVESSSAIEEMIANIQSIAGNLKASSREFDSLQEAITAGNGNIEELKSNVLFLSKQSDSVVEANSIIKNIASQTNLLAMNAAIEAAHAGESGRGFAVVADEIRKLAEVSNHQSKLISDSLKELKRSIEKAVSMTGETGESFAVIIKSVEAVNNLELEIKHAIDEQSSGSNQILQALTGINDITADVHSGSSEMLTGSNMILTEVRGLLEITGQVQASAMNVVEKAKTVQHNTNDSWELLSLNTANMKKIDELVGFFKIAAK